MDTLQGMAFTVLLLLTVTLSQTNNITKTQKYVKNVPCDTGRQFTCDDGQCIPGIHRCDYAEDCLDLSDEKGCPNRDCFICDDGQCIYKLWKCDGRPDCKDQSDERGCTSDIPLVQIPQLSYSVNLGSSVTMECIVTSKPLPAIVQWKKLVNDQFQNILPSTRYDGSTVLTPSLTIRNADLTDQGYFMCTATNSIGTGKGAEIFLDVTGNVPSVRIPQSAYRVTQGSSVTMECIVTSEPLHTIVQWRKLVSNQIQIISPSTRYEGSTVLMPSLTIRNADLTDKGNYICTATNSFGTGQGTQIFLDVTGSAPIVRIPQSSYSVSKGSTVTMECIVTSSPLHTSVQWKKLVNNVFQNLPPYNNYEGSTVTTPSLTIRNAGLIDKGIYICTAINSFGSGQSGQTLLDVTEITLFTRTTAPQSRTTTKQPATVPVIKTTTSKFDATWSPVNGTTEANSNAQVMISVAAGACVGVALITGIVVVSVVCYRRSRLKTQKQKNQRYELPTRSQLNMARRSDSNLYQGHKQPKTGESNLAHRDENGLKLPAEGKSKSKFNGTPKKDSTCKSESNPIYEELGSVYHYYSEIKDSNLPKRSLPATPNSKK